MAKIPEEIADPRTRSYCIQIDALNSSVRQTTAKINQTCQDMTAEIYQLDAGIRALFVPVTEKLRETVKAMHSVSDKLGKQRLEGFDARRAGKTITDNPHVTIVADLDGLLGYSIIVTDPFKAVSWYVGWKQAARAGETHYPD